MSPERVCRTAVAFLDQFISRGAVPDVYEVRRKRIDEPPTRQLLIEQLPGEDPDEREAFDAFRRFLSVELEQRPDRRFSNSGPDLIELLSWTEWNWDDGSVTADPAQWHDWLDAVAAAREPEG